MKVREGGKRFQVNGESLKGLLVLMMIQREIMWETFRITKKYKEGTKGGKNL